MASNVPIIDVARNQLKKAYDAIGQKWYGNAANAAKTYIAACKDPGYLSVCLLGMQMNEFNALTSVVGEIQKLLDSYAGQKATYETALQQNDVEIANATVERMDSIMGDINLKLSDVNTYTQNISYIYNLWGKGDVTLPTEISDKYVLSSSVIDEIIKNMDDASFSLKLLKDYLNEPENDSRELSGVYNGQTKIKILVPIGAARDIIITAVNWLIIQLETIKAGINHHVSNMEKFEKGEEVPLTNMFGQNVGGSTGEGTSVPGTTPNESAEDTDTKNQQEEKQETYVMKPGDTLIGVAAMYPGLTWKEIADANNITDTRNIPVGKELVIPGQTTNVPDAPNTNDSGGNPTQEKGEYIPAESFEGYQELKFSAIGESNWASEATSMNEGDYDSPFVVNSDGKMVDINGEEIWLQRGIGEGSNHRGFDYNGSKGNNGAADAGTPVYSLGSGIVIKADECKNPNNHNSYTESNNYGYGSTVWVLHEVVDDEGSVHYEVSKYEHFQQGSIKVGVGDVVDENTLLGAMGTTGKSTNVHLHLEVLRVPDDTLSAEELAGKSTEEVVDIVQDKKLDTYEYTYDRSNWVDFNQSLEDKGLL